MVRLKTLLLTLLMLCIAGYGSAWAFESSEVVVDEVVSITSSAEHQSVDQHLADGKICDHCCHAAAHMLAICVQGVHSFTSNKTSERFEFSQDIASVIISPDLRPPRV